MSEAVVVDVGANVGSFSVACLLRNAKFVVGFEPDENNFAQLRLNTQSFGDRFLGYNAAVWRSDVSETTHYYNPKENLTACGVVFHVDDKNPAPAKPVKNFSLDEILECVTDNGKSRVGLLKIDAEWSEYGILYTSKRLGLVDAIAVETHEGSAYEVDVWLSDFVGKSNAKYMKSFLESHGFLVDCFQECSGAFSNHILLGQRYTPILNPEDKCQSQKSTSSSLSSPMEATAAAPQSTQT